MVEDEEPWFEVHGSVNGAKLAVKVSPLPLRDPRLSSFFVKENDSWYVLIPSLHDVVVMTLIWWRFFVFFINFNPLWFYGGFDV